MAVELIEIINELECGGISCDIFGKSPDYISVYGASCDSRNCNDKNIFFCKGKNFEKAYLEGAIDGGCKVFFYDEDTKSAVEPFVKISNDELTFVKIDNMRRAMAITSRLAWGEPDRDLKIVGITGTKGKTTVATFVREALLKSGASCGFIGTHHVLDGKSDFTPPNTTPEAPLLYEYLHNMIENGCEYCVMEISSQGLKYDRVFGLNVDIGAIINVGIDHIAPVEHPSVEDYVASKFKISDLCENLVINEDLVLVPSVSELVKQQLGGLKERKNVYSYSKDDCDLELAMKGDFNKSNAACALKICELLGLDERQSKQAIKNTSVAGRMEITISKDKRLVGIVDYAHTRESYELFFNAINDDYKDSFVVAYFGASGGKALDRQVELPRTASKYCDFVIVTSDDPGPEDAGELADKVSLSLEGFVPFDPERPSFNKRYITEPNRDVACELSFDVAIRILQSESDVARVVVCSLGKGDEDVCVCAGDDIPIISDTKHVRDKIHEYDEL